MASDDPLPRWLAAGSAVAGTAVMMAEPAPSWNGVLVGIGCFLGWAVFAAVVRVSKPAVAAAPARPRPVSVEPVAEPPGVQLRRAVETSPTRLPEIRTHRHRVVERQTRRSR